MSKRYVRVPPPIARGWHLRDTITWIVDNEPRFAGKISNVRLGIRLIDAFAPDTAVVALEEPDWAFLCAVLVDPACGYAEGKWTRELDGKTVPFTPPARMFVGFVDSVEFATTAPPELPAVSPPDNPA